MQNIKYKAGMTVDVQTRSGDIFDYKLDKVDIADIKKGDWAAEGMQILRIHPKKPSRFVTFLKKLLHLI